MKKYILLLICLFPFIAPGQGAYTGDALWRKIQTNTTLSEHLSVIVVMRDQVDIESLLRQYEENEVPLDQRRRELPGILMKKAAGGQKDLLEFIKLYCNDHPGAASDIRSFWVTSAVVLTADRDLIQQISARNDVSFIELEEVFMMAPVTPVTVTPAGPKSAGGTEPGLLAVKAPFMWNMGYTGRNRISFSIDTGVWPDHPALKDRFLANFLPLNQCWFPYDRLLPGDKTGSHGTHTLGTTLGLDPLTHDTIGMAFGAYWICSDPVATSMATVKPLSDFMYAFQWAINPDGDTATVWDVPDVINNSWGYGVATDTTLCESYASQMFLAVEAAGIASVFSAGNDGPGVQTIGIPHHINTNIVNSFTAGAVNANTPAWPIASFSSRGPSICGDSGSLLIKPEVSAPGVDVRSAVDHNNYALYSGTSMASPHVTGAVLLLKEAFPFLAGSEILKALYFTATDLGIPGEDNDYGMGMIDLEQAFNYLSSLYTPLPPLTSGYDAVIAGISEPAQGYFCGQQILPQIVLLNAGDTVIKGGTFYYSINNGAPANLVWTDSLPAGNTVTVSLPGISLPATGNCELHVYFEPSAGATDISPVNNHGISRFNYRPEAPLPYVEDFENGIDSLAWHISNPDENITWDTMSAGGLLFSTRAAVMKFQVLIPFGQTDELVMPFFDLTSCDSAQLRFDVAYQNTHPSRSDTLRVFASTDCGLSFPYLLYEKGGQELETCDSVISGFVPWLPAHWRPEYIDLSGLSGYNRVLLKFSAYNRKGNNCFVDNIKVFCGQEPASVNDPADAAIILMPNPASDMITILTEAGITPESIRIFSASGKETKRIGFPGFHTSSYSIDISDLAPGMYILIMNSGARMFTKKFIIR